MAGCRRGGDGADGAGGFPAADPAASRPEGPQVPTPGLDGVATDAGEHGGALGVTIGRSVVGGVVWAWPAPRRRARHERLARREGGQPRASLWRGRTAVAPPRRLAWRPWPRAAGSVHRPPAGTERKGAPRPSKGSGRPRPPRRPRGGGRRGRADPVLDLEPGAVAFTAAVLASSGRCELWRPACSTLEGQRSGHAPGVALSRCTIRLRRTAEPGARA
jgi:hypothetical protein